MTTIPEGFGQNSSRRGRRVFFFLFGIPFFAAGAFIGWFLGVNPILLNLDSKSWPEVPCNIQSSRVQSHYSSDGTTYSVEIVYTYQWNDHLHTSDRYSFISSSSSGRAKKQRIVDLSPPGSMAVCYVNPKPPHDAVLSRELGLMPYIIFPFSAVFLAVGAGMMLFSLRSGKTANSTHGAFSQMPGPGSSLSRRQPATVPSVATTDAVQLKLEFSGKTVLGSLILIALFWNGIVSIFVWQAIDGFRESQPDWFLVVFLVPFVAVGLFLVFMICYQFLALFNPTLDLTLAPGTPRLGQSCLLHWRVKGNATRIRRLRVILEAEEAATYRSGKNTHTARNIFEQAVLADLDPSVSPDLSGSVDFLVPLDTMHSFKSSNNEVAWSIKTIGTIPRWPDMTAAYPLTVLPPRKP